MYVSSIHSNYTHTHVRGYTRAVNRIVNRHINNGGSINSSTASPLTPLRPSSRFLYIYICTYMYPTLRQIKITHRESRSIPSVSLTLTIGGRKCPPVQGSSVTGLRPEFVKVSPRWAGKRGTTSPLGVSRPQGLVNARRNYASQNYALQRHRCACVSHLTAPPRNKRLRVRRQILIVRLSLRFLAFPRGSNEVSFEYLNLYDIQAHDNGVTLRMGKPQRKGFFRRLFRFSIRRVKAGFCPQWCWIFIRVVGG